LQTQNSVALGRLLLDTAKTRIVVGAKTYGIPKLGLATRLV